MKALMLDRLRFKISVTYAPYCSKQFSDIFREVNIFNHIHNVLEVTEFHGIGFTLIF
jgi:hypothetical protein